MNNTSLILYQNIHSVSIFKKFDYIKLLCDIIFCIVNICKIIIYKL